jgi:hypothetical protein
MAGTVMPDMDVRVNRVMGMTGDEYGDKRLWAVVACRPKFGNLHLFRLQLLQAANETGLAFVRVGYRAAFRV